MSIYGTARRFYLDGAATGFDDVPVAVMEQVVGEWITEELDYLPPPRAAHPRAVVFVTDDSAKGGPGYGGQQYHSPPPLLVLSGEEWERATWRDVMDRLEAELERRRAEEPPPTAPARRPGKW